MSSTAGTSSATPTTSWTPQNILSSLFGGGSPSSHHSADSAADLPSPSQGRQSIHPQSHSSLVQHRRPSPADESSFADEDESRTTLEGDGDRSTMNTGASSSNLTAAAMGKKRETREKRVMPARSRRVTTLLGGGRLEDQWLGTSEPVPSQRLIPESTIFILTDDPELQQSATESALGDLDSAEWGFFDDPVVMRACQERAMIETPEFKLRDDSAQMGKTRGGATRSEEDTSDAAYERRHRRPDNQEKKQRRLEKERLVRDRQRLRDRIDQLKSLDARAFIPIIAARESQMTPNGSAEQPDGASGQASTPKQAPPPGDSITLEQAELLRKEMIAEATDSLLRYDALLTEAPPPLPQIVDVDRLKSTAEDKKPSGKRKVKKLRVTLPSSAASPMAGAASPSRASSSSRGRETPSRSQPRTSLSAASPPPGAVIAEHQYVNIHARGPGGRFAPKSAITSPEDGKGGSGGPGSSSDYKPRPLRPSELARKAAKEAERAAKAAGLPWVAPSPIGSSSGARKSSRISTSRNLSPSPSVVAAQAVYEQRRHQNRVGPSLAELDAAERRPKRVKLVLGSRKSHDASSASPSTTQAEANPKASSARLPTPEEPRISFAAPGALSLEQASAMMAAAMARRKSGSASTPTAAPALPALAQAVSAPETADAKIASTNTESTAATPAAAANATAAEELEVKMEIDPSPPGSDKASAEEKEVQEATTATSAIPDAPSSSSAPPSNPHTTTPTPGSAYMPGRSVSARQRAAMDIPLRRSSGRVKELTKGAFGERISSAVALREDFERCLERVRRGWNGVDVDVDGDGEEEEFDVDDVDEDEAADTVAGSVDGDLQDTTTVKVEEDDVESVAEQA